MIPRPPGGCWSSARSTATSRREARSCAPCAPDRCRPGPSCGSLWNLNPDGAAAGTRQNAHGVDLNRNFPDGWRAQGRPFDTYYSGPRPLSEPESRLAARLIRRLRPSVTVWYHQALALVDRGTADPGLVRRYARLAGLPVRRLGFLPGVATRWQNHLLPSAGAFVVELPGGPLSPAGARRHARAVRAVASTASQPPAASENAAISSRQKSGMSATTRPHTSVPSRKAGSFNPLRARVHEVVLDPQGPGRPGADDAGGDRHAAAVADDPDRKPPRVGGLHQTDQRGIAAHLVGRPAPGDDEPVEARGIDLRSRDIGAHLESVLAPVLLGVRADRDHRRALLAKAHDGHPVLEVLDALGDEDGVRAAGEAQPLDAFFEAFNGLRAFWTCSGSSPMG